MDLPPEVLKYALFVPAKLAVVLTSSALVVGLQVPRRACWAVAGFGWLAFVIVIGQTSQAGTDIAYFWEAGQDLRQGISPYDSHNILSLPTAFPFFWLLAATSKAGMLILWTWLNVLMAIALPFVARWALRGRVEEGLLTAPALAVVSAALCLSTGSIFCIFLGQLGLLVGLGLMLAIWAGRRHFLLAGFALTVGSIKITTMLPFLLLFHRRRDLKVWIATIGFGLAACLLFVSIDQLPGYLTDCWHNIRALSQPGKINDYLPPSNYHLICLERGFYHLGLTDRTLIRVFTLGLTGLMGFWVFRCLRGGLPGGAAASLVACYSALFLYHRIYDMSILAVPLVYAAGRAQVERGWPRWLYAAASLAILANWYLQVEPIVALAKEPLTGFAGRVVNAVVIPHPIWLVLAAMACLFAAERCRLVATVPSQFEFDRIQAILEDEQVGDTLRSLPDQTTAIESKTRVGAAGLFDPGHSLIGSNRQSTTQVNGN